jgi:anti-anti-sigma regulatory factor
VEQQHQNGTDRTCSLPRREPAPAFGQVIDTRGRVKARGDLTGRTADLLRGTVEALRRGGLSGFVIDLRGLHSADEAGLRSVEATRAAIEADGGRVTVLAPPATARTPRRVAAAER